MVLQVTRDKHSKDPLACLQGTTSRGLKTEAKRSAVWFPSKVIIKQLCMLRLHPWLCESPLLNGAKTESKKTKPRAGNPRLAVRAAPITRSLGWTGRRTPPPSFPSAACPCKQTPDVRTPNPTRNMDPNPTNISRICFPCPFLPRILLSRKPPPAIPGRTPIGLLKRRIFEQNGKGINPGLFPAPSSQLHNLGVGAAAKAAVAAAAAAAAVGAVAEAIELRCPICVIQGEAVLLRTPPRSFESCERV